MTAYGHVIDLFAEEANEPAFVGVPNLWLTVARHSWLLLIMRARITRQVKQATREVEDIALRLSGFTHRYPRMADTVTPAEEAAALCMAERVEAQFMRVRASILGMIQSVKPVAQHMPVLWKMLGTWNSAAVDACEAAQEMRWVVLECQAQRDIDQGRVQSFDSADAAIVSLRS